MYKVAAPFSITTFTDENTDAIIAELKSCNIDRVFLIGYDPVFSPNSPLYSLKERTQKVLTVLKENGFETGIWLSGFGHGAALSHEHGETQRVLDYVRLEGADGTAVEAFCPLDKSFLKDYSAGVKAIAELGPDIIMLDDDFRLNNRRNLYTSCCCKLHMESTYQKLGEVFPREELEQYVFSGGKNKYRDAWLAAQRESLINFAAELRRTVDSVDPSIRLGSCSCFDTWDYSGTDNIELAKTFAGNTKPFVRSIGAPYHGGGLRAHNIEMSRMQAHWCKDTGVEIFSEGDVYPRPCYNVPASYLELFDAALLATGETDGCLKYMFDYSFAFGYETGYTDLHKHNRPFREKLADMFRDKETVGVRVFEVMHTLENRTMPEKIHKGDTKSLARLNFTSDSCKFLSTNAIPTTYNEGGDYPVIAFGENAKYLSAEDLKNGAILDTDAAMFLSQKGIDTGLIRAENGHFSGEHYIKENMTVHGIGTVYGIAEIDLQKISCNPKAVPLTRYVPGDSVGSYLYENEEGQRFLVFAYRPTIDECENYFNTYYRQQQLIDSIQWLCGKELPIVCTKNPFLYAVVSKNSNRTKMSVALFNIFADPIVEPVVTLDSESYRLVSSANCNVTIDDNTATLSTIPAYGMAAFEVALK